MLLGSQLKIIHARIIRWSEELKTPADEVKPLSNDFWRMVFVFGVVLLIGSCKVYFDEYSKIIAELMEKYSVENTKCFFSWFYSDILCLMLLETFVLSLLGVMRLIREYCYESSWESDRPTVAETFRLLVLGIPLIAVVMGVSNSMAGVTLPAGVPDIVIWLDLIDKLVKIGGPCLIIELAKFHMSENNDECDDTPNSETV